MNSRRQFLIQAPAVCLSAVGAGTAQAAEPLAPPPGAPPTFGTAPAVGPDVDSSTFAEAEKLVQVSLRPAERAQAAASWRNTMPAMLERRVGPRTVALPPSVAPALQWQPAAVVGATGPQRQRFVRSVATGLPLPSRDEDIAFAPVSQLSRWVAAKTLSSERLTRIYLDRITRFDPQPARHHHLAARAGAGPGPRG